MNFFQKIWLAIKRNPKAFGISVFLAFTSIWAILEPIVSIYFPNPNKYLFSLFFIMPSIILVLIIIFPKQKIQINLKNTNTILNIKFGDLFDCNGNIVIAVNEYFDSEFGKPVSKASLHGIFIENILGGKNELFDNAVNDSLKGIKKVINIREVGKSDKYPIGTTACLNFGEKKYLLFALSKTNEKYEAHTTPSLIFEALDGLFAKARTECNGHELNLPLIGTGLSRSGIPPKYILELIMISILKVTKELEITKEINIILHDSYFNQINLNEIKQKWK